MTDTPKAKPAKADPNADLPDHVKDLLAEAGPGAVYDPVDDYPPRPYEQAKAE